MGFQDRGGASSLQKNPRNRSVPRQNGVKFRYTIWEYLDRIAESRTTLVKPLTST